MKLDPKLQAQLGEMFKPASPPAASLVVPSSADSLNTGNSPQLLMVEVDALQTGSQPRTEFDPAELQDLERSIGELSRAGQGIGGSGILQPLLARRLPDRKLHLVAGERRLRAAKAAGIVRVPVVVGEALSSEDAFGQAIVENLLRADLSPLEEAHALQKWMADTKLSLRAAAQKLGRDKGYLENRLRLLSMGEDVRTMVSFRKDTLPHARLIDAVRDAQQRKTLIEMVVEQGAGKREIESAIADYNTKSSAKSPIALGDVADQNGGEKAQKSRGKSVFTPAVQGAWKALQKASSGLETDEAIRLAEQLEKLAARLRKTTHAA